MRRRSPRDPIAWTAEAEERERKSIDEGERAVAVTSPERIDAVKETMRRRQSSISVLSLPHERRPSMLDVTQEMMLSSASTSPATSPRGGETAVAAAAAEPDSASTHQHQNQVRLSRSSSSLVGGLQRLVGMSSSTAGAQ